ncbi:MAG: DUF7594 domain-containing protein [Actinomycetota bacterium]
MSIGAGLTLLAGGVASASTYYEGPGRIEIHDSSDHVQPPAPDRDGPRLCTPLWGHLYGMAPGLLFRVKFEKRHTYETVAGPFLVVIAANGSARTPDVVLPQGNYKVKAQVGPDFEAKIYENFVVDCQAPDPVPDPQPDPTADPGPLPEVSVAHSSIAEGSGGEPSEAVFAVTLSASSTQTVTVDLRTSPGTAEAGSDYTTTRETVTFEPGATRRTVGVPVVSDDVEEEDEFFFANLSGPTNATLSDAQAFGTILDDDEVVAGAPLPPIAASADTTVVQGSPLANYGTATKLEADAEPVKRSLMKFQVSGLGNRTVTSVKLRLTCSNSSGRGGELRAVGTDWVESGLPGVTWATQPAVDMSAPALGSMGPVSSGTTYEVTLPASFVQGDGTYALVLTSGASDGADFRSREKGASVAPQLILTVE